MRAPAALAAAPAAAALAAAALAGERYDRRRPLHPRLPSRARSNEYCRPAASRLPDGSTRLAMRAPAALAAAPAAAALAAAALAGKRYDRRRPLHPRLPSRAPSRRARPTLLAHGTRRHSAAENRRCSARSARDLVLSRLDPAIPRVYTPLRIPSVPPSFTLSISRLANTTCCDRGWPISFFLSFGGPCGHPIRLVGLYNGDWTVFDVVEQCLTASNTTVVLLT